MSTIDTSLQTSTQYQSTVTKAGDKKVSDGGIISAEDIAQLSDEAKMLAAGMGSASTKSSSMSAIKKYLKAGSDTGATGLGANNAARKALGGRIDSVLKAAGIKLAKNEKLSISVNGKNEISVKGIKDKQKREAIEMALNEDAYLGLERLQYSANTRISDYTRRQEEYEKNMAEIGMIGASNEENSQSYNNSGMNALIMDEYLQEKAGLSLSDLKLEKGSGGVSISGMNDELRALMDSDSELSGVITSLLESGATGSEFGATFEFANGVISDNSNISEAKDKVDGIKNALFGTESEPGPLTAFRTKLENAGVELDPAFHKALSQGFQVEVSASGQFKIIGLEGLTDSQKSTLENLLQEAIEDWAENDAKNSSNPEIAEAAKQNGKDATLKDVVEAYVMEHQFEHGDTDDFEHKLTINFGSESTNIEVISPEADKAKDEDNQKLADELGTQLRGMLESNGINTQNMELEIDENGKITVLGDPANVEVKMAQDVIDQWVKDTKDEGALENKGTVDPKEEAASHEGRRADAYTPEGWGEQSVVASSGDETYKQMQYTAWRNEQYESVKQYLPDGEEVGLKTEKNQVAFAKYIGWQRDMIDAGDILKTGDSRLSISNIKPAKYANSYDDETTNESAKSLYLRMLDSMDQFHDGRKQSSYKFKVA